MRSSTRSMLVGAAVAALLVVLPAAGADTGWVTWPTKSYDAKELRIDNVVGDIRVTVQDGPMKVDVGGSKDLVAGLNVKNSGGTLMIDGSDSVSYSVWDWRSWFDFSHIRDDNRQGHLVIKVTVPKGTPMRIEDLVGNAAIGDTYGPVHSGICRVGLHDRKSQRGECFARRIGQDRNCGRVWRTQA